MFSTVNSQSTNLPLIWYSLDAQQVVIILKQLTPIVDSNSWLRMVQREIPHTLELNQCHW
jgi:hypothetical protein